MTLTKKILQESLESWLSTNQLYKSKVNTIRPNIVIGSSLGLVRKENQDRAIIAQFYSGKPKGKSYTVFALADGMGGMQEGAQCATITLSTFLSSLIYSTENNSNKKIESAAIAANEAVFKEYNGRGGATLSAVLYDSSGSKSAVNVGDSRIYHIEKQSGLSQISIDDTIDGQLEAIKKTPSKRVESNQLLQYVGMGQGIAPQLVQLKPQTKISHLLLTTDGAHCIGKTALSNLFKNTSNMSYFVWRALQLAEWYGGKDNATSICFSINSIKELSKITEKSRELVHVWDAKGEFSCVNYFQQSYTIKPPVAPESNKYSERKESRILSESNLTWNQGKKNTQDKRKKDKKQIADSPRPKDKIQLEVIDFIETEDKK